MRIVFAIPGNTFSRIFLQCWSETMAFCRVNNIEGVLSSAYSANIYSVRNACLFGNFLRGKHQKPFNGKKYDYVMWIDSDTVWTKNDLLHLIEDNVDIVSGFCLQGDMKNFAVSPLGAEKDIEHMKKHGRPRYFTYADIKDKEELMQASLVGFGFLLVKYGVFESMEYPWIDVMRFEVGNLVGFSSEDFAFCTKAREAGFKLYADPEVIVGHEKPTVLHPKYYNYE